MVAQALEARLSNMVANVQNVVDLDAALTEITGMLGFRYFALSHHVDTCKPSDGTIRLHNYPERWAQDYDRRSLGIVDPVHRASHVTLLGFRWSQLASLIPLTREDLLILEEGQRQGIGDGFTVPANMAGEAHGSCSFANDAGQDMRDSTMIYAQLAGTYAFETARKLWFKRGLLPHVRVAVLTDRQRDCVLLMAQGKSDKEIAMILGISRETVTSHVVTACKRYGIYKRQLLVTLTLYDGTLTFSDVKPWRYPHFLE